MPKIKKVKQEKKFAYTLTLVVNGEKFIAQGNNLEETILALKSPTPKTKGIFTLESNGKISRSVPFFIWQLNRLFGYNLSAQIQRAVLMKKLIL
jgi:hypothetical protein